MIKDFFCQKIAAFYPHTPNAEQSLALDILSDFLSAPSQDNLLLFNGYAGTGKTTMLGATVKMMDMLHQKVILLAPTGRAAKVFSDYAGHPASTIHKRIYRQKNDGAFSLSPNLYKNTLFIVDEASMISNECTERPVFGNGYLLDDLIEYVYSGSYCRLILMGDSAQLPPVSLTESPALSAEYLKRYHLQLVEIHLRQVVRQQEDSGILFNATHLRQALYNKQTDIFPSILTTQFADIRKIDGNELIDEISSAYNRDGIDNTIIICRSNKNANIYNNGVRNRILYREEELSSGDRLMIVKNNYYWGKEQDNFDFIANGEIVQVLRVRHIEDAYGFRFCNVKVRFIDYEMEIECKMLLDTLHSEAPALPKEANDKLFAAIAEAYADVRLKSDRMKMIKNDPYFNAIQVKYAYAITCHKAQGGQWDNVFLDIGHITDEMLGDEFYRWLYTAFTRANQRLYLVNFKFYS